MGVKDIISRKTIRFNDKVFMLNGSCRNRVSVYFLTQVQTKTGEKTKQKKKEQAITII